MCHPCVRACAHVRVCVRVHVRTHVRVLLVQFAERSAECCLRLVAERSAQIAGFREIGPHLLGLLLESILVPCVVPK